MYSIPRLQKHKEVTIICASAGACTAMAAPIMSQASLNHMPDICRQGRIPLVCAVQLSCSILLKMLHLLQDALNLMVLCLLHLQRYHSHEKKPQDAAPCTLATLLACTVTKRTLSTCIAWEGYK